jgi:hypothetical protein
VAAVVVIGWAALARRAPAKEHTAGCAELGALIGRVRASLDAAASQRQRGSSLGAYQVLRATADSIVRESTGDHCGALGTTLAAAVTRAAAAHTALEASVELDLGLASALSLATDGRLPRSSAPPKVPVAGLSPGGAALVGEAAVYAEDCPDLFRLTLRLDGPAAGLPDRVKALLRDLDARPRCGGVRRLLAHAPADRLAHAVDSIRLDEPDTLPGTDAGGDLLMRCPELPQVLERLASAIDVGAPQFNSGDAAGCQHTYEAAARAVTTQIVADERCPGVRALLATGLARAEGAATANEAAWALRHSFDAILAGPAPSSP